jgi:hypothetical protein
MDDTRLARHVIDRLEHRWASRLQQDAKAWTCDKSKSINRRHVQFSGRRELPGTVRRARRAADAFRFE